MQRPGLEYITTLSLQHSGDCSLVGVTPDFTIFAEEIYGKEGWMAQHSLTLDGNMLESVDEEFGGKTNLQPLPRPAQLARPQTGWHTMRLNFSGPRHRGLRGLERTPDLVRPLTLQEKMLLIKTYKLDIAPPMLMGLAESYVLSEAMLTPPDLFVVCRRVRLAYQFSEQRLDDNQQPYDYDTCVIYLAHFYDRSDDEPSLHECVAGQDSLLLNRPMDCLAAYNHLFVAEGGSDQEQVLSRIHIWRIDYPDEPAEEQSLY